MANEENIIKSFMELGLSEQKAKETYKNATVTKTLLTILNEVRLCYNYNLQLVKKIYSLLYR